MKRIIRVKNINIGEYGFIPIQSMTNTKTEDVESTICQCNELIDAGVDIIRISVPTISAARAIKEIVCRVNAPLVADIHYDYKLAIMAVENGVHKIRINPGNIGSLDKVKYLASFLNEREIPIRVGVNSGSIHKDILAKYGNNGQALAESAMTHVRILEDCGFTNTIISVKSSNVIQTIEANRLLSKYEYPLHIGVTEAGVDDTAIIKSALGIGILLNQGIGDTIRVSLSGTPIKEVIVARKLLSYLGLGKPYPNVIACPTCARTCIDVENIARRIEAQLAGVDSDITVAVMGCIVNGIGEGKEADIGIAGGKDNSAIFLDGEIVGTFSNDKIEEELLRRIEVLTNDKIL